MGQAARSVCCRDLAAQRADPDFGEARSSRSQCPDVGTRMRGISPSLPCRKGCSRCRTRQGSSMTKNLLTSLSSTTAITPPRFTRISLPPPAGACPDRRRATERRRRGCRRYWSPQDIAPVRLPSDQAYAEGLRERLDIAVRRQLRSAPSCRPPISPAAWILHPLRCSPGSRAGRKELASPDLHPDAETRI